MRSSLVVRASDCQCTSCNGSGFDPSIRRHSGIWGAADVAVLNIVRKFKKSMSSIGKEFRRQSAFTAFRGLLPSANYSAEWSGWVWQPAADSNSCLAHFLKVVSAPNSHYSHTWPSKLQFLKRAPNGYHYLQQAVTPDWIGCIALWEHIIEFFARAKSPLRV